MLTCKIMVLILGCISCYFWGDLSAILKIDTKFRDLYLDFDKAMRKGFTDSEYIDYLDKKPQKSDFAFFKNLYEQNNFLKKANELSTGKKLKTVLIPKIIHQIWLGSPFPECYKKYRESWQRLHPEWEYRLWTDADVASFGLVNQRIFNAARNYAEKSDIWRYEILERFGGLYVDTDFECFQDLDMLHDYYEFYAGLPTINRFALVNNAIIGSIPHHPILKQCIAAVGKKKQEDETFFSTGPIVFCNSIIQSCLYDLTVNTSSVIILPAPYFYSLPTHDDVVEDFICESSLAVHHWVSKWNAC